MGWKKRQTSSQYVYHCCGLARLSLLADGVAVHLPAMKPDPPVMSLLAISAPLTSLVALAVEASYL